MTRPRRVLLAWEYGRNLGHLARLSAVADLVEQGGAEPVWAVPAEFGQAPLLRAVSHRKYRTPSMGLKAPPEAAGARANSFADILLSLGWGQAELIAGSLRAWLALLAKERPARVVLDYAPAAQLAASLARVPAIQITNGFDAPPPDCPCYGLGMRGPYLDRLNEAKVAKINEAIQVAVSAMGFEGASLASLLRYPRQVLDCIEETDLYTPREDALYVGPLGSVPNAAACEWPDAPGPRVLGYLRGMVSGQEILSKLQQRGISAVCVWPDAEATVLEAFRGTSIHVTRDSVSLARLLPQADAVLNYGSTGFVCQTLLAGKPQLMLPVDTEKLLVAGKVASLGAGLTWRVGELALDSALDRWLGDGALREAAARTASRYSDAHWAAARRWLASWLASGSTGV